MEMKNTKRLFIVLGTSILILLLWAAIHSTPVIAATPSGSGFFVKARLPENQLNQTVSYFDLRMQPSQTQILEVEITNDFDTPISVNIEAISASTNRNGIIDYKTPDIQDESLHTPLSDIVTASEETLVILGNSTQIATFTVIMPDDSFDGTILGGLVFTREVDEEIQGDSTIINNMFSYVIGLKLSELDTIILPEFEIVKVFPETVNYRPSFTHSIRNMRPLIIKGMNVRATVRDKSGAIQATTSMMNVDMAPNSIMPLGAAPENGLLAPGKYHSAIELEYDGDIFTFDVPFTIEDTDAEQINAESVTKTSQTHNLLPLILIIALTIIIFLVLLFFKKKKDEKNEHI